MIKKRFVTLLELIIAMGLTTVILTILTYFYRDVTYIGQELDRVKFQNFYLRYVENRLMKILPKTLKGKESDFAFFSIPEDGLTKGESLIFTYSSGANLVPIFSNDDIARLFVDRKNRLMIVRWPTPRRLEAEASNVIPIKQEVLMEGVESLKFQFYAADDSKIESRNPSRKASGTEPEAKGQWSDGPWLSDYEQLPALMKIIVKPIDHPPVTFAIPLPNSKARIIYPME